MTAFEKAMSGDAPLKGAMLWLVAIVLAGANFIAVLDMTIANVSVPNIAGSLGISSSQGTWVITSYAVAEAITVPLTGWLAARFGAVRVFTTAMRHVRRVLRALRLRTELRRCWSSAASCRAWRAAR